VGDQANDTRLNLTGIGTLAMSGTGEFYAGQKPNGADWGVSGSTLDIQGAMTVYGTLENIGQFGAVKMVSGATYIHERNSARDYPNDWILEGGPVTFRQRWENNNARMNLDGVVSGNGALVFVGKNNNQIWRLRNPTNLYTGRTIVDAGRLEISSGNEASLGPNPPSLVPDQLELLNGGMFYAGSTLILDDPNRGLRVGAGGGTISAISDLVLLSPISGVGDLVVGGGNVYLGNAASSHSGVTVVDLGVLRLSTDNGLFSGTVVDILNDGTGARFDLNGFDLTIAGLRDSGAGGSGTKQLQNGGATATLTLNVPAGQSHSFSRNIQDNLGGGAMNIVKEGLGTQVFNRTEGAYASFSGEVVVNNGWLRVDGNGFSSSSGQWQVNSGGLAGTGVLGGPVTVNAGGALAPGASLGTLTVNNQLSLGGEVVMEISNNGGLASDQIVGITALSYGGTLVVTNVGGTALGVGDQWTLFAAAAATGQFDGISPGEPGPGLAWAFDYTNGILSVVTTGPITNPPPVLTNRIAAGHYEFSWSSDYLGFTLQSQTNALSVGLDPVDWRDIPGTESTTTHTQAIDPAIPSVFFRLSYTNAP
jgi:hypothetical protein